MNIDDFFESLSAIPFEIDSDIVDDYDGETEKQTKYCANIGIPDGIDWIAAVDRLVNNPDVMEYIEWNTNGEIQDIEVSPNKDMRQVTIFFMNVQTKDECLEYEDASND